MRRRSSQSPRIVGKHQHQVIDAHSLQAEVDIPYRIADREGVIVDLAGDLGERGDLVDPPGADADHDQEQEGKSADQAGKEGESSDHNHNLFSGSGVGSAAGAGQLRKQEKC